MRQEFPLTSHRFLPCGQNLTKITPEKVFKISLHAPGSPFTPHLSLPYSLSPTEENMLNFKMLGEDKKHMERTGFWNAEQPQDGMV